MQIKENLLHGTFVYSHGLDLLDHIAALEQELAEACDIDSVQASMLGPLRSRLALAEAVCEAAEAMRDVSIDLRTALGLEYKVHDALDAWRKAKGETE